jgi:nitroreductase
MTTDAAADPVLAAIAGRRSVRGYLDRPVPRSTMETILTAAARAPSGNNTQPWHVHVLTGAAKTRLTAAILAAGGNPMPEYPYYPERWAEPYLTRRRTLGWNLYGLLGIARGDREAARAWHDRNYAFFGAPVGMVFTLDRDLGRGAWLDLGMFLQNVMTAARGLGLDSCPQAALAHPHEIVRRELSVPAQQIVVCGMALGWADPDAVPNRLVSQREPLAGWATFAE